MERRDLRRRVVALDAYGLAYVRNAKAGTSTVLLWLHRLHTGDHHFTPTGSIHAGHGLPRPGRQVPEGFWFSFVRHPVDRAESAYRDKVLDAQRLGYPGRRSWQRVAELQRTLGLPEDPDAALSPGQFVDALEVLAHTTTDVHWRPQRLNLMHETVAYDHIGHLETFAEDLAHITEACGLPDVPAPRQNGTARDESLFSAGLQRRIETIYAADCERYGY